MSYKHPVSITAFLHLYCADETLRGLDPITRETVLVKLRSDEDFLVNEIEKATEGDVKSYLQEVLGLVREKISLAVNQTAEE